MNVDDRMGSCRDKGRMWGRVGAWWQRAPVGTAWSTKVAPQPGQAQGPLIHTTPPLVPTGPWDASISMDRITRFGRQHSSGLDLAGGEELSSAFEPCLKTANADEPGTLSPLHFPSEEAGGVLLQAVCCFLSGLAGGSHSETWLGCIVSCTTVIRCSLN